MRIATSTPKGFHLGSLLIRWYQNTKFSHTLIIKDDLVFQASHGYVNCNHIDIFLEDNLLIDVFDVPNEAVDFDFVKKQLGKPYGYTQIYNIVTKFLFGVILFKCNNGSQYICSEYVGNALKLPWVNDYTTPKEVDDYLRQTYPQETNT